MKISKEQIEQLHPIETKILTHTAACNNFTADMVANETDLVLGQVNQGISWLTGKQLITETSRRAQTAFELTELGAGWRDEGSPHKLIFEHVKKTPATFAEITAAIASVTQSDVGSAYGLLSKDGALTMDDQKRIMAPDCAETPEVIQLLDIALQTCGTAPDAQSPDAQVSDEKTHARITDMLEKFSKKRGAGAAPFKKTEREIITYTLTDTGREWVAAAKKYGITGQEINALTSTMLKDGSWKQKTFRAYNISLPPGRVPVGREHPYARFLRSVKDKLISLGFTEFDGSLVETEFWNSDALFMPQFHAARDIHDVYYIAEPTHAREIPSVYLDAVAQEHESGAASGSRGWNYSFDKNFTKRLILRSQGTVMSAKTLPTAAVPGKYFGVLRVFRHDQVDATHLSDFYQTEGIILGEDVSLCTLLGLLKIFAEEFAHAEEVKYVPGYFPFTEPSVEVHIKHPDIGWMELGGSGIFRPEVTKPLGINVPVAAWGIGVDRMATMQMNIKDLRDLFSYDLEQTILRRGVRL